MPIIESSLDIGGKIIPWNEQTINKLIKEKEEKIQPIEEEKIEAVVEEKVEEKQDAKIEENASKIKQDAPMQLKKNKKKDKAGEI